VTQPLDLRRRVADALGRLGWHVAVRPADVQPPCFYVVTWSVSDSEAELAEPGRCVVAAWWVPLRGLQDPDGDDAALGAMVTALSPLTPDVVVASTVTLLVNDQPWPAWRADVSG
jgi:hypothetical protein